MDHMIEDVGPLTLVGGDHPDLFRLYPRFQEFRRQFLHVGRFSPRKSPHCGIVARWPGLVSEGSTLAALPIQERRPTCADFLLSHRTPEKHGPVTLRPGKLDSAQLTLR